MQSLSISDVHYTELVEAIYSAGCHPERWHRFVERMHAIVPFSALGFILAIEGTGFAPATASARSPGAAAGAFKRHFWRVNADERHLLLRPIGGPFEACLTIDDVEQTHDHGDWLSAEGDIAGGASLTLALDDRRLFKASIDLPRSHIGLGPESLRLLARLGPHLMRAFEMNERLNAVRHSESTLANVLETIEGVALIVSETARPLCVTAKAEVLFCRGDIMRLTREGLVTFAGDAQVRFLAALTGSTGPKRDTPVPFALHDQKGELTTVHVLPLRGSTRPIDTESGPGFLVIVKPLSKRARPPAAALQLVFRLTLAEARVVQHIAEGFTPPEVADLFQVSTATVRNQLAAAMTKLGVNRRAELVSIVVNLTPALSLNERH